MNKISNAVDGVTLGLIKGVDTVANAGKLAKREERGDIVQTILIIAIFVVIVVVVGNLLYKSINSAATKTSGCINKASANVTAATNGADKC